MTAYLSPSALATLAVRTAEQTRDAVRVRRAVEATLRRGVEEKSELRIVWETPVEVTV